VIAYRLTDFEGSGFGSVSSEALTPRGGRRRRRQRGRATLGWLQLQEELLAWRPSASKLDKSSSTQSRWTPALKTKYASLRTPAELTVCEAAAAGTRQPASISFGAEAVQKGAARPPAAQEAVPHGERWPPQSRKTRRSAPLWSRDRSRDFSARRAAKSSQEAARETAPPAERPADPHRPRRSPGANAPPEPWCATSSTPRRPRKNGSTSSSA
jgi:hypothetical protein